MQRTDGRVQPTMVGVLNVVIALGEVIAQLPDSDPLKARLRAIESDLLDVVRGVEGER